MKRYTLVALLLASAPAVFAANLIQNGDMETFTGNLPTGWTGVQISSAGVTGGSYTTNQSTDTPTATGNSLEVVNPGPSDTTFRYKAHSNSFLPTTAPGTITSSMKGASARIMLGRSTDAGITWTVSGAAADVQNGNSATWVTPTPKTGVTSDFDNANVNRRCRLSTHTFTATSSAFFENVAFDATAVPVELSAFSIE